MISDHGIAVVAKGDSSSMPCTETELEAEIVEIDCMLDSSSAWLTPRTRTALLAAREVIVQVLQRRKDRWPPLFEERPARPQAAHARPSSLFRMIQGSSLGA